MSEPQTTPEPDDDPLPEISLQAFLTGVAKDYACDDEELSVKTLRLILRDYRDHARRLLGTDARALR